MTQNLYSCVFGPNLKSLGARKIVKEIVAKGSSLHHVHKGGRTPFLELLFTHIFHSQAQPPFDQFLLRIWLEDLHEAGVNLEDYGRCEIKLREREMVCWSFPVDKKLVPWDFPMIETNLAWTLEELVWGPSPNDWKIQLKRMDHFSAHESKYRIPGSWTEDDQIGAGQEKGGGEQEACKGIEVLDLGSEEGGLVKGDGESQDSEELIPGTQRWREYSMMIYHERMRIRMEKHDSFFQDLSRCVG